MAERSRKRPVRKKLRQKTDPGQPKAKYIAVTVVAVCLCIAAFFVIKDFWSEEQTFDSEKYIVKGIDVSHHNPILNWEHVMEQGISFAYIKASEGNSHQDRNYPFNYDRARQSNVKVGAYHFYTFGLSGKEQAQHFLKTAKFNAGDMIPAIDVEHSPANPYSEDKKYVAMVIKELKVLENELYEHFGVHPVIYANHDCYKLYIKSNFPDNLIWMCDLHSEPPKGMDNWRIWQFSHEGEIPGIDGAIDLNYYRYTFDEFKELLLP